MRFARLFAAAVFAVALAACTTQEARVAEHKKKADEFFEAKQWSEAKIEFLNVLKAQPDDADSNYKMAETYWALQEYGDALWRYKEAVRLAPEKTEWRLKLAQALFLARDYDLALENLEAILEKDPRHIDALLLRGGLRTAKGDFDGLAADVDAALAVDPDHASALALKAQALGRKGDVAGAEEALRHLVEKHPSAGNHITFARFLAVTNQNDGAAKEIEAAIGAAASDEERTLARLFQANFYLNQRDPEKSEQALLKAREETPKSGDVLLALASFYFSRDQREKAEQMLEESVVAQPDKPEPILVLADFHRRTGDTQKALAAVDRALKLDPKSEQANLRRAEFLVAQRGTTATPTAEAWKIVKEVLDENPRSLLGLFTEGKFYLLEQKYKDAATSLRRVIDEQPENANAHVLLGTAYLAEKDLDLARTEFQLALQSDAQNSAALSQLSALYLASGDLENAEVQAKRALELDPKDVRVRLVLADALVRRKRTAEAKEVMRAVELQDDVAPERRLQVARLHRATGDSQAALALLEKLRESSPTDPMVLGEILQIDLDQRNSQGALARVNAWIAANPEAGSLYYLRARVRLSPPERERPGSVSQAEADLRTAIEKDPASAEPVLELAQLYRGLAAKDPANLQRALDTYEEARKRLPKNAKIALERAGVLESAKRLDEARQGYEEVLRLDQEQPEAKNNLAWLIANGENPSPAELDRALALAREAKQALGGHPSIADTVGWIMLKKGIASAAIPLFRESLDGYPAGHPLRGTVRYHLAVAYDINGDRDRAIEELKGVLDEVQGFPERGEAESLLKRLSSKDG